MFVFVRKYIRTRRYINISVGDTVCQSKTTECLEFATGKAAFGEEHLTSLGVPC